jgi:hypothetical protein
MKQTLDARIFFRESLVRSIPVSPTSGGEGGATLCRDESVGAPRVTSDT